MTRPPPTSPLFPSTPLSRSRRPPTVRQSADPRSAPKITRSRGLRIFCFHVEAEDPQASTARDFGRAAGVRGLANGGGPARSGERRGGEERRCRGWPCHLKKK